MMGESIRKNNILVNDYHVIRAEPKHFDQLIELFLDISLWLRSKGLTQWSHFLDGYGRDDVIESINSRNCWLVTKGNAIVGTVTVQYEPDEWDRHIWNDTNLDSSIFIHRFAISRSHSNRGIGRDILCWIEGNYALTANKKYIKLDCVSDNKRLNDYYLSNGFEYVGCTDDGHSKYQKTLGKNGGESRIHTNITKHNTHAAGLTPLARPMYIRGRQLGSYTSRPQIGAI